MKKSKEKEEKNPKKGGIKSKKVAKVTSHLPEEGFFLPKEYKNKVKWKENPLYRSSFLLLLLTLVWIAVSAPRWKFNQEWQKAASDLQRTSLQESEWVAASLTKIRPIRNKYREIEKILQYRRIALGPILASLQKHIPDEISLNKINWQSTLEKTTNNLDVTGRQSRATENFSGKRSTREAVLKLEIYATPKWKEQQKKRSPAGWLVNLDKDLARQGIRIKARDIGTENPFMVETPPGSGQFQAKGYYIEVTLTLELDGPKMPVANTRKPPTLTPPASVVTPPKI